MALKLKGSTSGFVAIDAPSVAGNNTLILPENTGSAHQILANDITAGVTTFTQVTVSRNGDLTVPGTISIGGTLTYEDVTSVDSVGIVTARGLSIFGNTTGLQVASGISTFQAVQTVGLTNTIASGNVIALLDSSNASQNHRVRINSQGASSSTSLVISNSNANNQTSLVHGNDGVFSIRSGQTAGSEPTSGSERLRITTGGELQVTGGTGANVIINAATHDASTANQARLQLAYQHSGGQALGHIRLDEGATNSFDGIFRIGVPYNNGSGGSSTREVIEADFNGNIAIPGSTTTFDTTARTAGLQLYYESDSGQATIASYSGGGNTHLSLYTNASGNAATEKLRITSTGQVGINQTPDASGGLVQIRYNEVYTSGTTNLLTSASKAALRIRTSSDSSKSLYFGGIDESATPYLQVGNMSSASGGATASYPLVLQPYGGNVGIHSLAPSQMLDVYNNNSGVSAKVRICAANGGQAGLELIAGSGSVNRAGRIDFINMNTSSSPQWTVINDYQQNGGNHLGFYHGAEKAIVAIPDSRVELYNNGLERLRTHSDGVIVSDDGVNNLTLTTNRFIVNRDEAYFFDQNNTGNSFIFRMSNTSGLDTNALQLYSQGHAYFISRSTSASSITVRKGVSGADSIDYIQCRANSNALKFVVEGDGDVKNSNNSYGQTSDSKLKENIVDANSQWNDIKAVKVRNFNFKESTGLPTLKQIGVVAQELETTSPNLVEESIDRDPDTGENLGTTTKNVKYSILYMKSVKALQEAMARIETLEAKVASLEG